MKNSIEIQLNIKSNDIYAIAQVISVLRQSSKFFEENNRTKVYAVSPHLTGTCYMMLSALCFEDVYHDALSYLQIDSRLGITIDSSSDNFLYLYQRLEPSAYRSLADDISSALSMKIDDELSKLSEAEPEKIRCKGVRKNGKSCNHKIPLQLDAVQAKQLISKHQQMTCKECGNEVTLAIMGNKIRFVGSERMPDSHKEHIQKTRDAFVDKIEQFERRNTKEDKEMQENTVRFLSNTKMLTLNTSEDSKEHIKTSFS